MRPLNELQMCEIHDASVSVLLKSGIVFDDAGALELFKAKGFRVDGRRVFFTESQILKSLETTPQRFTLFARNSSKDVQIGTNSTAFVGGYGAHYINACDGTRREATMQDYDSFCKLAQSSPVVDITNSALVQPCDIASSTAHLDMIYSTIILSDKPFMVTPACGQAASECLDMAGFLWDGRHNIRNKPVTVGLIHSMSPLGFTGGMTEALVQFALAGQPCIISPFLVLSDVLSLPSAMVLQNARFLAGLTLAQTITPGNPVVYGAVMAVGNRKKGFVVGSRESSTNIAHTAAMARYYGIPSRTWGSVTDAHIPDAWAAMESAITLTAAIQSGTHLVTHACGMLSSLSSICYEKFVLDEALCSTAYSRHQSGQVENFAINEEEINTIAGAKGLENPSKRLRKMLETSQPVAGPDYLDWRRNGSQTALDEASEEVRRRLATYEKPDIAPGVEADLSRYLLGRKNNPRKKAA